MLSLFFNVGVRDSFALRTHFKIFIHLGMSPQFSGRRISIIYVRIIKQTAAVGAVLNNNVSCNLNWEILVLMMRLICS